MELVLSTYGTMLNRDNEGFIVTQNGQRQRIPADDLTLIQISKAASITSDAVLLAIEKEIEVVFVDKAGKPQGRIWSPKYGSVSNIRKGQLRFSQSGEAFLWIRDVLAKKINNQQALILTMQAGNTTTDQTESALNKLNNYKQKVLSLKAERVSDVAASLRGYEGMASKIYFSALNSFLPEHLRFQERSQHPALDPVNAFLNYGYGLLYSKIEGALIKAGIDPYIGILHRDEYNRPVLVYDVIELYRIWIDYVVWTLACQDIITDDCYSIKNNQSYWLEPFGRRVLIQSVNDYLDELIVENSLSRTRATHINLYAQNLAQKFKQYKQL